VAISVFGREILEGELVYSVAAAKIPARLPCLPWRTQRACQPAHPALGETARCAVQCCPSATKQTHQLERRCAPASWPADAVALTLRPKACADLIPASLHLPARCHAAGGQSITTQNIMDVILESNTDPVATPFRVSPTPGSAPQPQQQAQQGAAGPQAGTQQGKTFGRSGSIAVADAWMRQQQAAASMAALQAMQAGSTLLQSPRSPSPRSPSPQPQQLQFQSSGSLPTSLPTSKRGLQLPSTWAVQEQMTGLPPAPEPPLRMTGGEEVSAGPEELAAELDTLLGALSGEDFAGADLSTRVSMQLAGVAEEEGKEAHRADDPARPIIPLARQRHASLPAQNGSAFRRVNLQQASLPLPAATPFAASGNGRPPSGAHMRHWQSGSSAAPASSSNLSNNSCSLRPPMSPFESTPFGSLAHAASLPVSPSSTGVQHSPRDTLARVSGTPGTGTAAHMGPGARLQSTGEVWDAMRSKALMNNTPGVKFVQFAAGAEMDIPTQAAGAYCLLIESGELPVPGERLADSGGSCVQVFRWKDSCGVLYAVLVPGLITSPNCPPTPAAAAMQASWMCGTWQYWTTTGSARAHAAAALPASPTATVRMRRRSGALSGATLWREGRKRRLWVRAACACPAPP
jgi:hypothetical protein